MTIPLETLILIKPRTHDIGGLEVNRVLPSSAQRMVGPFVFFDHMGPATFLPSQGVDVRPHPHIGLATVTYLFSGDMMHRDSLGSVQEIMPGDVNWMTAGRGIVHSERTSMKARATGSRLHGIQAWVALPESNEQGDPGFNHHPSTTLPKITDNGIDMSLIAGTSFGKTSPAPTFSAMFYIAVHMQPGSRFELPAEHEERGIYVVEGDVTIDGQSIPPQHLVAVKHTNPVVITAIDKSRLMLLGGDKLGDRFIWWNFVASSKELIEDAKQRWKEQQFPAIAGETEFIPLPDR